jgi:IclR family transcriptional regulator, acetate operon repressor
MPRPVVLAIRVEERMSDDGIEPGLAAQRSKAGQKQRPAVLRTMQLLEKLAQTGRSVALTELARELEMPQATVFRLCQKLEAEGYIARHGETRKYALGARLMRLGLEIVRNGGPLDRRHAILSEIVRAIGETCNITALVGAEVLYLDRVETQWPLRLTLEPGSRVPMHCTASGKLLLALLPRPVQQRILKDLVLTPNTRNTFTDRVALMQDLQRIAERGYSTDNEEFLAGLVAVAVPIRDCHGRAFAAIACHGPVTRLPLAQAVELAPLLNDAAARLAETFQM